MNKILGINKVIWLFKFANIAFCMLCNIYNPLWISCFDWHYTLPRRLFVWCKVPRVGYPFNVHFDTLYTVESESCFDCNHHIWRNSYLFDIKCKNLYVSVVAILNRRIRGMRCAKFCSCWSLQWWTQQRWKGKALMI